MDVVPAEAARAGARPCVRITQIDGGKIPNLALMKLAHWHRQQGHEIVFKRSVLRGLFEPEYHAVYGSTLFTASRALVARFRSEFPNAIVGGSGLTAEDGDGFRLTVESVIGSNTYDGVDYGLYPDELRSVGRTQTGCRFRCEPCIVWRTEGSVREASSLREIWRGDPYPRHILLLDNDTFGQPRVRWQSLLAEARDGDYRVCFSQGINVRAITPAIAREIASIKYRNNRFTRPRLYTAFDNLKDKAIFLRGLHHLLDAGVHPDHLMVYVLVGLDEEETWDRILERFHAIVDLGARAYPMPYRPLGSHSKPANSLDYWRLKQFQRYANTGVYKFESFDHYDANTKGSMAERRRYREIALSLFEPNEF